MRISILQTDIVWENKQENLRRLREKLETLRGTTEIVVLPETFSTGFSMDTASWRRKSGGRIHCSYCGSRPGNEGHSIQAAVYSSRDIG
jgi:hypothetical protein